MADKDELGKKLVDAAEGAVEAAKDAAGGAVDKAADVAGAGVDAAKGALGAVGGMLGGLGGKAAKAAKDAAAKAGDLAGDAVDAAKGAAAKAADLAGDAVDAVKDTAGDVVDGAGKLAAGAADAVGDVAGGAVDAAKGAAGAVAGAVGGVVDKAGDVAGDAVDAAKGAAGAVAGAVGGVVDKAGDVAGGAVDAAKGAAGAVAGAVGGVVDKAGDVAGGAVGAVGDVAGGAVDAAKGLVGGATGAVAGAGAAVLGGAAALTGGFGARKDNDGGAAAAAGGGASGGDLPPLSERLAARDNGNTLGGLAFGALLVGGLGFLAWWGLQQMNDRKPMAPPAVVAAPAAPTVPSWFAGLVEKLKAPFAWLGLSAAGNIVTASGEAPDAATKASALSTLEADIKAAAGEAKILIVDNITVAGSADTPVGAALAALGANPDVTACAKAFTDTMNGRTINFETGGAGISADSARLLDALTGVATVCKAHRIEIAGHTDTVGTPENNQTLSQSRADAVKAYWAERAVPVEGLAAVGYGETKSLEDLGDEKASAKNRRIEFAVTAAQ